ncbi:MAG: hypothetical protein M3P44_13695 [Actinomycetota bacterium]|nr:hypothetical protein [Actinomycetota bacterium]
MRNRQLHQALAAFAEEAGLQLAHETAAGAEVPFEVVSGGRRDAPFYCYRPLTGDFIEERLTLLGRLPSFLPAVHGLSVCGGLERYLEARGERGYPADGRARAEFALRVFLTRTFEESTEFSLTAERLERAYSELETCLYDGRTDTVAIAPLLGLELDSDELALGDGLTLVRGDALAEDAPAEALWAAGAGRPHLLAVLRWEDAPGDLSAVAHARARLRRLLTALRLFDAGSFAFGPVAWTRTAFGAWEPFALGALGARRESPIRIEIGHEDELRAFCSLVTRRTPESGELAWALRRFELACERPVVAEALTDVTLALRALLEPEGPASGRLPGRLAAICALPEGRAALTDRVAHTVALERTLMTGAPADPELEQLGAELTEHLRALLRDALCGHLHGDLRVLADRIIGEAASTEHPTLA